jgi:phage replication O-like protein O
MWWRGTGGFTFRMTESPQLENGHGKIANEIMEALSRTYMSSYESQFLWCLFRKTYGWSKKDDWISLSQITEETGIHKAHASRTKKKLITRRIVTQTGNKLAFNKYYSQWMRLPKQVPVTQTGTPAQTGNTPTPIQVITPPPKQADTISIPKETSTRERESLRVPTPAQEAKAFFDDESIREKHIANIVAKGLPEHVARAEVKKFLQYWTELNQSGTKQRWQLEKTFELRKRLSNWLTKSQTIYAAH